MYRVVLMIANILELINLMVLFKVVLGCGFRRNRSLLFIGGLLAAGYLLMYQIPVLADFVIAWGPYVIWPFYVLITVSLFEGKIWTTAGLSITLWLFNVTVAGFFDNIAIIRMNGYLSKVDFRALYCVALILIISGFLVTGKQLGKKRETIRNYLYSVNPIVWIIVIGCLDIMRVEWTYSGGLTDYEVEMVGKKRETIRNYLYSVNPIVWIIVIGCLDIMRVEWTYSGGLTDYEVEMVRSYNLIKDGIFGIALLLLLCLLGAYSYQRRILQRTIRLNEKCLAEQAAQYAFMGEKEYELRKFRHDYNRHFYLMQNLLRQEKYRELENYFDELKPAAENLQFLSTGNLVCDAIVNQYYLLCREKNIDLSVVGKVSKNLSISQTDLCVILSNGLENAVEAAEQCDENRQITLHFRNEMNLLFIDLNNPASHPLTFSEEGLPQTNKKDKKNHGIGTRNMKSAAEKNYGEVCWEYDSRGFVLTKIVLPCGELQSE